MDVVDKFGNSPLHDAVQSRKIEVANILLDQRIVGEIETAEDLWTDNRQKKDRIKIHIKRMLC